MMRTTRTPSFDARQFQLTVSVGMNAACATEIEQFIRAQPNSSVPKVVWAFAEKLAQCAARANEFADGGTPRNDSGAVGFGDGIADEVDQAWESRNQHS